MKIAFYHGKGGTFIERLFDRLVRLITSSKYSHCELVIDDCCYSSSMRDYGVRLKRMILDPAKWDVLEVPGDEHKALAWFQLHIACEYDYVAVLRFILPWLPQASNKYFCSESVAQALGFKLSSRLSPGILHDVYTTLTKPSEIK